MPYDSATLDRLFSREADPANRRRALTILEYLDIRPGNCVLDCGCGLGWHLHVIGTLHACRLHGTDVDVVRLARAAAEVGSRAALTAASIASLPYAPDTFDRIVLSEVLEHVPNDRGGLREVRRVLKPGGVVAITVPNRQYPFLWDPINASRERLGFDPIRRGVFGGIWTNHLRLYDVEDIVGLVRSAGLIVDDVRHFVHYCLPFAHNLVYGAGKALVDRHVLPGADRFRYAHGSTSMANPLNWAIGIVNWIDRFNSDTAPPRQTTVCIAVKARKA